MHLKRANRTTFIGSSTSGANGDVATFRAPRGIDISLSGDDIRWPDGARLQRVGLKPDIEVSPTNYGIRAERDEVLEKAVEFLSRQWFWNPFESVYSQLKILPDAFAADRTAWHASPGGAGPRISEPSNVAAISVSKPEHDHGTRRKRLQSTMRQVTFG